jgi:uncharacterized protein
VSPGSARSSVVGRHGDAWKLRIAAAPERGKANDAVVALLASTVGIPVGDVELVRGATSRDKVALLHGVTEADAETRMTSAAEGMS